MVVDQSYHLTCFGLDCKKGRLVTQHHEELDLIPDLTSHLEQNKKELFVREASRNTPQDELIWTSVVKVSGSHNMLPLFIFVSLTLVHPRTYPKSLKQY